MHLLEEVFGYVLIHLHQLRQSDAADSLWSVFVFTEKRGNAQSPNTMQAVI